ncbi:MAG: phosphodiester glycosidase family protein, partial [Spirochaetaceae bacterium]|nr:phosphodiester glycosidase family protein [Spirochaetaceae bacterium]
MRGNHAVLNGSLILSRLALTAVILSCSSLSVRSNSVPCPPLDVKRVTRAASPEDAAPVWQAFDSGVDYCALRIKSPKLRAWALRVDLSRKDIGVTVSGKEPVKGIVRNGVVPSLKVTSFVRRSGCIAGINTNPFSPVSAKEGESRTVVGVTIDKGAVVSPPDPQYDALVFYYNDGGGNGGGTAAVVSQEALIDACGIAYAVGGFYRVLRQGALPPPRSQARHPRSAAGVSSDGKTLYLLVIDG